MIERRIERSTSTALAFIATSMAPPRPPNRKIATAPAQTESTRVMPMMVGMNSSAATCTTGLEPKRAICMPAIGISSREPMPKTNSIMPRWASLSDRALAKTGIFGAQAPIIRPLMKNSIDTAARVRVK